MAKYDRYFRVCPRGFRNEMIYFRVPAGQTQEVEALFERFEDENPSGSAGWVKNRKTLQYARYPGVAVDWADRARVGY